MRFGSNFRAWIVAATMVFPIAAYADTPQFTIYYGTSPSVGSPGFPQVWANVLGRVISTDGIAELTYTLNGVAGPELNVGPDDRRLTEPGDFVIELAVSDLVAGNNVVVIDVTDGAGDTNSITVDVDATLGATWPLPYTIDWSTSPDLVDVLDVIDGEWETVPGGVRLVGQSNAMEYDRVLAIGDVTWSDYSIAAQITIHDYAPGALGRTDGSATVGVTTSWQGHGVLKPGEQPHTNWLPQGGNISYDFFYQGAERFYLGLGNNSTTSINPAPPSLQLDLDTTYWFKLSSLTLPGGATEYRAKVWEDGQPEPTAWTLERVEEDDGQNVGSALLVAHHVDATFGNVLVNPIVDDGTPPTISNVVVDQHGDFARISWSTDEAATGLLRVGEDTSYATFTGSGDGYDFDHRVTVPALAFGQEYHFQIEASDKWKNTGTTADATFTTSSPPTTNLTSDEFCGSGLNGWVLYDPLADTTVSFTGSAATLTTDPGSAHDYFTSDTLPRLRRTFVDGDLWLEVEFANELVTGQTHGFLFEEASPGVGKAVRVDLTFQAKLRLFHGRLEDGTVQSSASVAIPSGSRFLRVRRQNNVWSTYTSTNGTDWTVGPQFTWSQVVQSVGISAGNDAGVAHASGVERFTDLSSPTPPPTITNVTDPASDTGCEDEGVLLSVSFDAPIPVHLSWRQDGAVVPGENSVTLLATTSGDYEAVLDTGCETLVTAAATVTLVPCPDDFVRGDPNLDGSLNIADAIAVLAHLFDGAPLTCDDAIDVNDDGSKDVSDAITILTHLFSSGAAPSAPHPDCGADPTADGLGCDTSNCP
ncbi:MAG: dockerin type I repeat-containing protein [Planctomycetota bacterium]